MKFAKEARLQAILSNVLKFYMPSSVFAFSSVLGSLPYNTSVYLFIYLFYINIQFICQQERKQNIVIPYSPAELP